METISLKSRFITIMLLLIAVHGDESFPFNFLSSDESEFLSFQPQQLIQESSFSQDSENSFLPSDFGFSEEQFPLETQSVSDDTNMPLEIQQIPQETDLQSEILQIPKPYAPSPVPAKARAPVPVPVPAKAPAPAPVPAIAAVPAKAPSSPTPPLTFERSCKTKCSAKCLSKKTPILHNLCNKVCTNRCVVLYWQSIYYCTDRCAMFMPDVIKSDKKKAAAYVSNCFRGCTKKYD